MLDLDYLKSLSPDAAQDYLTAQLQGGLGDYVPGGEGSGFGEGAVPGDPGYYSNLGKGISVTQHYADNPVGYFGEGGAWEGGGSDLRRTAVIPDGRDGPAYLAEFGQDGKLTAVGRQPENSWYEHEVFGVPIGALLPLAGAAAGAYFPGAVAAEGAAPIIQASGTEALIGGTAADTLSVGGAGAGGAGGVGTGFGQIGSGTFGMNAAYTPAALAAAEAATLPVLTPAMTSLGYTALPGAAALGAGALGLAAGPGAAGTMSFLDASKAAIAAGAPAGGSLTGLEALLSGAKDVWNTGKAAYTAAAPVVSAGKKLYDAVTGSGSGSGSGTSSGGLGGLGGIGGILGLALLMAQLRKDRNAPTANATPVIPRLRSRVEQKPFTLDAQGNKQAPLAYFGQPVYYAAGGGIGGLAAGGQASRAVRGPGDGVSDSIPARINGEEPAALADGEFVIDARTVAELGNGSTEAGTRKLEAMVNRVHHARAKARRGEDSGADRHMPA